MKSSSIASYILPRTRDIVFLLVFAVAMAAGWRTLNTDGDLPRHLLMGQVIVQNHAVPQNEIFSAVYAGRPYVAHEWLADVIYYLFYAALGLKGVILLTGILVATAFYLLYKALSELYEERFVILILVLWGAANTYQHWIARPHLFTILYLAIWLILVDRLGRGGKVKVWVLPALMLIWGNTHGEFIAGFLVLIAYIAGWFWDYAFHRPGANLEIIKKLSVAFGLSLIASLINPFGLRTWTTVVGYLNNSGLMTTIHETRAPDFTNPGFYIEFALILASVLILALKKEKLASGQAFLLTGFTALALTAGRNIHLYGVVAPFVLAGPAVEITDSALQRKLTSAVMVVERQLKGFVWPVATVLVCLILLVGGRLGSSYYLDPRLFPVEATAWLDTHPQSGQMFNDFKWGGYLVWKLWPAHMDFIDSQTDTSGEATTLYYHVANLDPGWESLLDQYKIQWAVLPVDAPLSAALERAGWVRLYQDDTAVVLRRE